jgi:hypothetical protein
MSFGPRRTMRASIVSGRRRSQAAAKDRSRLLSLNRSRVDRLLGGRDGARAKRLLVFLQSMSLSDGAALIAHVKMDDWPSAGAEARADAFSLINNRIVVLREAGGAPAFDDPLPGSGAPDNVYLRLRKLLVGARE